MLPHFGNHEYTCLLRHCDFCIYSFLSLEFTELRAGGSFQMSILVLTSGTNSWDSKSNMLSGQAAWILYVGLCTPLGRQMFLGLFSIPPCLSRCPGPPLADSEHTALPLGLPPVCFTTCTDSLNRLQGLLCFLFLPSSPDKEAGAPSRLLEQPKKEPVPFLPSQVSPFCNLRYVQKTQPA